MNKVIAFASLMACSLGAHASSVEMADSELSAVSGQLNLISLVNAGILSDSVFREPLKIPIFSAVCD